MSSENNLLILAVAVALVSFVGFLFAGGLQTDLINFAPNSSGNVTVVITQDLNIVFTTNLINWSSGSVASGFNNATLGSQGEISGNLSFQNVSQGFVLENIGNINASIDLKTGQNETGFIGGDLLIRKYQYRVITCLLDTSFCGYTVPIINDPDGQSSCIFASGFNQNQYYDVNDTGPRGTRVCDKLSFEDDKDQLRVDMRVVIPSNAPIGPRSDTLIATAIAV